MSSSLEPTPEQFAALAARPADAPVVMINLLQFKAAGGRESYLRLRAGGRPRTFNE